MASTTTASFPIPTTKLTDDQGNMSFAWISFFTSLYQAVGSGQLQPATAAQFQNSGAVANTLDVYSNGKKIGTILVTP